MLVFVGVPTIEVDIEISEMSDSGTTRPGSKFIVEWERSSITPIELVVLCAATAVYFPTTFVYSGEKEGVLTLGEV